MWTPYPARSRCWWDVPGQGRQPSSRSSSAGAGPTADRCDGTASRCPAHRCRCWRGAACSTILIDPGWRPRLRPQIISRCSAVPWSTTASTPPLGSTGGWATCPEENCGSRSWRWAWHSPPQSPCWTSHSGVSSLGTAVALLDEPFRGLEPRHREQVAAALRLLAERGTAVLYADHDVESVRRTADRLFSVEQGATRLVEGFRERSLHEWYHAWPR